MPDCVTNIDCVAGIFGAFSLLVDLLFRRPTDAADLAKSCGLCRDKLAFVGDAKDGLPGVVRTAPRGSGIRLGVRGTFVEGNGEDNLRRLAGDDCIVLELLIMKYSY